MNLLRDLCRYKMIHQMKIISSRIAMTKVLIIHEEDVLLSDSFINNEILILSEMFDLP